MKKTIIARLLIVGALLLVGGGLTLWKVRSVRAASSGGAAFEPAEAVEIIAAGTTRWRPTASLSGTVVALQSVTLSNEVAGTVREVRFESGAVVEAGQELLILDSATEQADLRAAEAAVDVADAQVRAAEADLSLAESHLRRISRAVEARAVSEAEMDQARSALDAASARLRRAGAERDQAAARVDQMKATIAKKTLRAPFRALAGLRNIHPGQYLAEGTTVVGLQSTADEIYLDFALPQEHASRVKPGDVVMAKAPMLGEGPLRIQVVALDAVANPTTRNVRLRAIVPNPGQRLRPGMFVDVEAPAGDEREYVAVPLTAVRRASFGDHVFVISPDPDDPTRMRARQRFVRLGPSFGNDVIVLEGVRPGEEIAAAGAFKLREGALVMRGSGAAGNAAGEHPAGPR